MLKESLKLRNLLLLIICTTFATSYGQVLNPNDPIIEYDEDNPPSVPTHGTIAKWVRTKRVNWNTDAFKSYYYKGMAFRLRFPENYDPSGNTKYPLILMLTGRGEAGSVYDNEINLKHAAQDHQNHILAGDYNGFLMFPQSVNGYWNNYLYAINELLTEHFPNEIQLDRNRIVIHGLSAGGQGVWSMIDQYPETFAAALPMSAAASIYTGIPNYKYLKIWLSQGGNDHNPTPFTSKGLADEIANAGGNIDYTLFVNGGHAIWNSHYSESEFWPYINEANRTNPAILLGSLDLYSSTSNKEIYRFFPKSEFCPGEEVNLTLGVVDGLDGYEWRRDGVILEGEGSNELVVDSYGTYDVRLLEDGEWSHWSLEPVVVKEKETTVTPDITVSGLNSRVIPTPNGNTSVPLELPEGFSEYQWKLQGGVEILGTERTFIATQPGEYVARVTELFGCSSNFSNPISILDANGPNTPPTINGAIGVATTGTSIELAWTSNQGSYPASGYEIYRSGDQGDSFVLVTVVGGLENTYSDEDLLPGTEYRYLIRPINDSSAAQSFELSASTLKDELSPSTPSNFSVTSTTSNSVSLRWDESLDSTGVKSYEIFKNGVLSLVTENTEITAYNLQEKTPYQFMVRAKDHSGNVSPMSRVIIGVPVNTGIYYEYFEGTWDLLPDFETLTPVKSGIVEDFDITTRDQNNNFGYFFESNISIPVAGNYTFETRSDDGSQLYIGDYSSENLVVDNDGLHGMRYREGTYNFPEAGSYKLIVTFFEKGGGQGLEVYWKNTAHGVTSRELIPSSYFKDEYVLPGTAPEAPNGLTAMSTSFNTVELSWMDNSTSEIGFQIFRSEGDDGFTPISIVNQNVTNYTDTGLSGSTQYFYQIAAIGQYGSSMTAYDLNNLLGDINLGIAAQDGASGSGYIMYSEENLFSRFSSNSPHSSNSDHVIAIKRINDEWYYDNNNSYYQFDPVEGDLLLAEVDFSGDQIDGLEGTSGSVFGIESGFESGDLEFFANRWNGGNNNGEFTILGTQFVRNSENIAEVTTLSTPPAPNAISDVVLTPVSSSEVQISWLNNYDADAFTILRSIDNQLFIPILHIEDNVEADVITSDSGLFPHTTYFYQVEATNVAGGAMSTVFSVSTLNSVPGGLNFPQELVVSHSSTHDVQIYTTDPDGDNLTLTASNLPSFASLTDYGDGSGLLSITPDQNDASLEPYQDIIISVSDGFGGLITSHFDLIVSNNHLPVLSGIDDIVLSEGAFVSLDVLVEDEDGDELIWGTTLPDFVSLAVNVDGNATLEISPGFIDHGVYQCELTVDDQQGGSVTKDFMITVEDVELNTNVLVNFTAITYAETPWNNITSVGEQELMNTEGAASGISLELMTDSWLAYQLGAQSGDDSGAFPDAVLQDYYFFGMFGGPETVDLRVSGLTVGIPYDFSFVASSVWNGVADNGTTVYTSNGVSASVYSQGNTEETADLVGLLPDANGEIIVTMSMADDGTPIGYVNGFSISSSFGENEVPAVPTDLSASLIDSQVHLSWRDAPYNENGFNIYRSTGDNSSYALIGTVSSNEESFVDSNLTQGDEYFYVVTAFNGVGESVYSNEASYLIPDTPPSIVLEAISSAYVDQTTIVNFTVSDEPLNIFSTSVENLPEFGVFTDNGSGGSITLTPSIGHLGDYTITIRAVDNQGQESTEVLNFSVLEEQLYSIALNFSDNSIEPSPWNNTAKAPAVNDSFNNLIDDSGIATSVSVTLETAFGNVFNLGSTTGDNSGVVPDNVLQEYYWWGFNGATSNTMQLRVSGLDQSNKYSFKFVGSSEYYGSGITDNGETDYSIGNKTVSVDVDANTDRIGVISNVVADDNGEVVVTMTLGEGAVIGYINGMIIEAYPTNPGTFNPSDLVATPLDQSSIQLSWVDNSIDELGFEVEKSSDPSGPFSYHSTVSANETSLTDSGLTQGSVHYYRVRAIYAGGGYSDYTEVAYGTTIAFYVYVNMNGVPQYDADEPWNNLGVDPGNGAQFYGFKNHTGNETGILFEVVQRMQGNNDWGVLPGNDSGVFPDNVMRSFFFSERLEDPAVYRLSGLDVSMKYNIKFHGSISTEFINGSWFVSTDFRVGQEVVTQNNVDNMGVVSINNINPSDLGEIIFEVTETEGSLWAIFNGFSIEAYPSETNISSAKTVAQLNPASKSGYLVSYGKRSSEHNSGMVLGAAYPNPVRNEISIEIENTTFGESAVELSILDTFGRELLSEKKITSDSRLTLREGIEDLRSGAYVLRVNINGSIYNQVILKK